MDLLEPYRLEINYNKILEEQKKAEAELHREHWNYYYQLIQQLKINPRTNFWYEYEQDTKIIDVSLGLSENNASRIINELINALIPWRKGPFRVFDSKIDSEWQSWIKWKRLQNALPDLSRKKIADVGSGNGYFMFQLAKSKPELVLGFERSVLSVQQFNFLQLFAQDPALQLNLIDSNALQYFEGFFDLILCMGVIYHSRNPLMLLENIRISLKNQGVAFIESQIWPGEGSFCFFNQERYAKMKNVYFIPTLDTLKAWLRRTGFKKIEVISVDKTTIEEQRKTEFSSSESLKDCLDPNNQGLTIEGHPAPIRALIRAQKI